MVSFTLSPADFWGGGCPAEVWSAVGCSLCHSLSRIEPGTYLTSIKPPVQAFPLASQRFWGGWVEAVQPTTSLAK